jgi:hypothetical protein
MKKICPVCGSNNAPDAVKCVNCAADLNGNQHMVDRAPVEPGKQGNPLGQVQAQSAMPTNNKVTTREVPNSMMRRVRREDLSDELVDSVDEDRMGQIQHSADHLGL